MYILFAILASLAVYVVLVNIFRLTRHALDHTLRLALLSLLVMLTALIVFNVASQAVGVDLGPGHAVSYDIPSDYLAKGTWGSIALIPYALACIAPALAWALWRTRY